MREEGLLRFIGLGVCEHNYNFHRLAIETGVVDVILTFLDYTLISQTTPESLLPLAAEHDIGVINGSPIAMGWLSGVEPYANAGTPEGQKAHQLWKWAEGNNLSLLNFAIQFCLRQPLIYDKLHWLQRRGSGRAELCGCNNACSREDLGGGLPMEAVASKE